MQSLKAKIKRKLSIHDKNPSFEDVSDSEDLDHETHGHLQREYEQAETANEPHGKPGSFLNKLIMHGNKKTEEQLARDAALTHGAKENQKPVTT